MLGTSQDGGCRGKRCAHQIGPITYLTSGVRTCLLVRGESVQQPGACGAPAGGAAAVALTGAIIVGLARFIETASLHAAEFGVGMTIAAWLMLVLPMSGSGD